MGRTRNAHLCALGTAPRRPSPCVRACRFSRARCSAATAGYPSPGRKSRDYCWHLGCIIPKSVSNDRANRPLEDPIESSCPILDLSGAAVSLHSCTNRPFCLAITVRARCRPELPVPWLI